MDVPSSRHQVDRRVLMKAALATPGVAGVLAVQQSSAGAAVPVSRRKRIRLRRAQLKSVDPELHRRQTDSGRSRPSSTNVYTTGQRATRGLRVAGITWEGGGTDAYFLVRTRSQETGEWSEWYELHDDGHTPDAESEEVAKARLGTDPLIVELADRIEVRVETDGPLPRDAYVELVAPGTAESDDALSPLQPMLTDIELRRPYIWRRREWGADESIREQDRPNYGVVRGMFVHHTAGSNSYGWSDVPAIIRGIYVYQVETRGWRDIGYNFLIDKYGRIWMGRWGGWNKPVVGAHARGYNSSSFGVAVLGDYSTKHVEWAMLNAYEQLIAWKFALHDVSPTALVAYPDRKTLPAISGHRDANATVCPGDSLHGHLETIRSGVSDTLARTQVSSTLTWRAHTDTARLRTKIWFRVRWESLGRGVDGKVAFQRKTSTGWHTIRYHTVTNGVGWVWTKPSRSRIYRIRSVHTTNPLNVEPISGDEIPMTAVSTDTSLVMKRAGATTPDGEVPIRVEWYVGDVGVTGTVAQQYWRNGWITSKTVTVTNGVGQAILRPKRTLVYRMRGRDASSPSNVDLSHPASTSNEFLVVVD